jgi:hypothetical protein
VPAASAIWAVLRQIATRRIRRGGRLPEFVEIPDAAKVPKPLFPVLPSFALVREVQQWVNDGNATYNWRGHTHTAPDVEDVVEFIGLFTLPKGTKAPCPCCTPNHTKFGKGVVGWFEKSHCIRLMGEHCFKSLNPEGYERARRRMDERQGRRATIAYLTANLFKKDHARRAIETVLPLAEHLDDLQLILGERLRIKRGIDLWQYLRDGGNLKISTETRQGTFNTNYALVAGYRLVDPARKKLVPTLNTALRAFEKIGVPAQIIAGTDREREAASRYFSQGLRLARDIFYDLADLRELVSVTSTATIRNWSMQSGAAASVFMRREDLAVLIGKTEDTATRIPLKPAISMALPSLPDISLTQQ